MMMVTMAMATPASRKQASGGLVVINTQFGEFGVVFDSGRHVAGTHFLNYPGDAPENPWESRFERIKPTHPQVRDVMKRIEAYFKGDFKTSFADIGTPDGPSFYRKCWDACRSVRPGKTISYAELAERAGNGMACRAAGQAMRNNRLPVIIPCHRIVGHGGHLGGFAGSCAPSSVHVQLKRELLEFESSIGMCSIRTHNLTHSSVDLQ